jgi:hypothetical protein
MNKLHPLAGKGVLFAKIHEDQVTAPHLMSHTANRLDALARTDEYYLNEFVKMGLLRSVYHLAANDYSLSPEYFISLIYLHLYILFCKKRRQMQSLARIYRHLLLKLHIKFLKRAENFIEKVFRIIFVNYITLLAL